MNKILISIFFCLFSIVSIGQSDLELAQYYYNNGEYELAKLYFENLYKNNKTNQVYTQYLNTLIALGEYEEAEKMVKKKLKSSKNKATAHVDLGDLYKRFGDQKKANAEFDEALKELQPGRANVSRLATMFTKLNEYDFALKTYEKGKRISTDGYEYHYELANLQGAMGDYEAMVESFLELLMDSPNYIQTVQNSLNRNLNIQENGDKAEMLKTKLLKRTQKYPSVTIYSDMLIWLFLQEKEFSAALVQAKALDQRLGENGFRIVDIAQLAFNSKDFYTARDGYSYLIQKGPTYEYYTVAKSQLLVVRFEEVKQTQGYTSEDVQEVVLLYEQTITELGKSSKTAVMIKELAHIKAFYLQESEEAIELLYEAIDIPGVYGKVNAIIKLELADILLLEGDLWDASLLYSQVELDFKEDPLGHEAKFRNARISYYTGDFEWAQAQLDVLKASTTKLISNDAIDLSLLITDNYAMDTITTPMLMFAQADLLAYQNRNDEAFLKLDSIISLWPGHALTDDILMKKAEVLQRIGKYEEAIPFLQEVLDLHFHDILADDALFQLAEIYDYVLFDEEKSKALYEKLILEYPGSLYVLEARKRFRVLRGDELN